MESLCCTLKLNIMLYFNDISVKKNKYFKNKCWHTQKKKDHTHSQTAYICFYVDAAHFYHSLLKPQTSTTAAPSRPLKPLKHKTRPGKHLQQNLGQPAAVMPRPSSRPGLLPGTTHGIICRAFDNPDTWMSDVRISDANVLQVKNLCFRYIESESNGSWSKLVPWVIFFYY